LHGLINNNIVSEPRYLDRQLPLQLVGTPLGFAVAVGSQDAVELLVHLGANPIIGPPNWTSDSRNKSPIHLATSLHLVTILDLLVNEITRIWTMNDDFDESIKNCLDSVWKTIAESSPIERTFIHGRHMQRVVREMLFFLREVVVTTYPLPSILTTNTLITSSIGMGDIAIAKAELPLPQRNEDGIMESRLSMANRNLLMLMCAKTASSGAFDSPDCYGLLEFALSRGSRLDCDWDAADEQRAINTAIEFHRAEILDWFIENGASLNIMDNKGLYPLHYLINSGFSSTYSVKKLLNAGADPNAREGPDWTFGDTALQLAIKKNRLDDVSLLLQYGANPTMLCSAQGDVPLLSALHCAIGIQNLDIISLLLKRQPSEAISPAIGSHNVVQIIKSLSQQDGGGNSPLLAAALKGNATIVNMLLEAGADLSAVNSTSHQYNGYNCMHCAASRRHDVLLSIFAKKMDVNSKTLASGSTALHLAASALRKDPEAACRCCFALLKAGADPRIPDNQGHTSLYWIASAFTEKDDERRHHIRRPLLDMMVEKGISLDHKTLGGQVPCMLHQAIDNLELTFVQDLLELGASVDIRDNMGWTPLRKCVSLGNGTSFKKPKVMMAKTCKIAELLIHRGADIYVLDELGVSLLEHAVISRNVPMVHLLLKYFEVGVTRVPTQPGNTIETPLSSVSSVLPPKPTKRGVLLGKFKQIIKPKGTPTADEARLKSKAQAEERFEKVGSVDRTIITTAWKVAITRAYWDCIAAFIDRDLHGETDILPTSSSLGLLRYALEEDIAMGLMAFMGSQQHLLSGSLIELRKADPVLHATWKLALKTPEHRRLLHSMSRVSQLIQAGGFTPLLDLPSLVEKRYVEAQQEEAQKNFSRKNFRMISDSLKEVVASSTETELAPPVIALFDGEEDQNEENEHFAEDVQAQLNTLIDRMRVKSGIFLPRDTQAERDMYQEARAWLTANHHSYITANANGFVQGEGGRPWWSYDPS
jgi:ankyrin repeat protein